MWVVETRVDIREQAVDSDMRIKKGTPIGTSASSPPRTEGIELIDALTLVRVRAVGVGLGEIR